MKKILLLIMILFVSCKTTKKVEHYTGTHYSATELASQLNLGRYSVIDESKIGELHIYIYDTSLAKDTGGGFYSPIIAEIVQRDTTQTTTHVKDTITYTDNATEVVKESVKTEKKTTRLRTNEILVLVILIAIFLLVILRRR